MTLYYLGEKKRDTPMIMYSVLPVLAELISTWKSLSFYLRFVYYHYTLHKLELNIPRLKISVCLPQQLYFEDWAHCTNILQCLIYMFRADRLVWVIVLYYLQVINLCTTYEKATHILLFWTESSRYYQSIFCK